jgi:general stress protein 26
MWFQLTDNALWCASHESSRIIAALQENPKCAFELAGNDMPYRGVRGQGDVVLHRKGAGAVLERLLARYLDESNASLAAWLRSRADGEYAIEIQPRWVSAWDYRHRMRA